MTQHDTRELFRDEATEWAALTELLEAFPCELLTAGEPPWYGAAVYAHLARWFARTASDLQTLAHGSDAPPATDADALNATWRGEDRHLSPEAARSRAMAERWRLLTIAAETPRACWTDAFVHALRAGTLEHYREHRESFIVRSVRAGV